MGICIIPVDIWNISVLTGVKRCANQATSEASLGRAVRVFEAEAVTIAIPGPIRVAGV
jgi:hypothetical protein